MIQYEKKKSEVRPGGEPQGTGAGGSSQCCYCWISCIHGLNISLLCVNMSLKEALSIHIFIKSLIWLELVSLGDVGEMCVRDVVYFNSV